MAGWRIGFAVGNTKLIYALTRIKSYLDYGAFYTCSSCSCFCSKWSQSCVEDIRNTYQRRRDVLITSMARSGWDIPKPQASMFAWAPLPEKYKSKGSLEFAKELMLKADVAVAPGVAFGEYGEGYVRVGLVENEQRIRQAAKNIKKYYYKF